MAMPTNGLELIGSRPLSRLDTRPPTHRSASARWKTASALNIRADDSEFGQRDASGRPDKYSRGLSQSRLPKDNGTLRGNGVQLSSRSSSRSVASDRPPSGLGTGTRQPAAVRRPSKHHQRHSVASYVDESLFGSTMPQQANFKAPWESTKRSDRPPSRPSSAMKMAKQTSYIDNSLFGEQLEAATWHAPWHEKSSTRKPLLFDAFDYRLTVEHDNVKTVKEPTSLFRPKSMGNLDKKQPWR